MIFPDNLNKEIQSKITKGYPLKNTIFEDTKRLVLYQNGKVIHDKEISADSLIIALSQFFDYSEPDVDDFYRAVKIFEENIPHLEIVDIGEALHYAQESNPTLMGEAISIWLQGVEQNNEE